MRQAAVIFPGQGAQTVGMGKDVAEASPRARAVFERANAIVGFDLAKLCFEGPAEQLERTDIQQPAIFVTSVALWEALLEAGARLDQFSFAAGLSLGEYTALHVAGAFSFEGALRLVQRRGQLMQEAAVASPSGMISLVGADEAKASSLCDAARGDDVLAPANYNCPGQVVISGSGAACDRAERLAKDHDCRAVRLGVAGAFHSPLMETAAAGLGPALEETAVERTEPPVMANVSAEYHGDPARIREALRRQVTHPVLWQRCVERMIGDGAEVFIEVGPGRTLTGMMRKINREMTAINVSAAASIQQALPVAGAG